MKTLEKISYNVVHKGKNNNLAPQHQAIVQVRVNELLIALHDAINSPKGVVPVSADDFYCYQYYNKKENNNV